jgi:hypothetical protein
MAQAQDLGREPEWLVLPEPAQPLEQPRLGHGSPAEADLDLRATYPIDIDGLPNPLDMEASAAHPIAPYVLERTSRENQG